MKKTLLLLLIILTSPSLAQALDNSGCVNLTSDQIWVDYDYATLLGTAGDGSIETPYATIEEAFADTSGSTTICVVTSTTPYSITRSTLSGWTIYGGHSVNADRTSVDRNPTTFETILNPATSVTAENMAIDGFTMTLYSGTTQYKMTMNGTSAALSSNHFHTGSKQNILFDCNTSSGCEYSFENNTVDVDNTLGDNNRQGTQLSTFTVVDFRSAVSLTGITHTINLQLSYNIFTLSEDPVTVVFIDIDLVQGSQLEGEITGNEFLVSGSYSALTNFTGISFYPYTADQTSEANFAIKSNHIIADGTFSSQTVTNFLWLAGESDADSENSNTILVDGNTVLTKSPSLSAFVFYNDYINVNLTNNIVVDNSCSGSCMVASVIDNENGTINFLNNTFMYLGTGTQRGYFISYTRSPSIGYINNNIFYNADGSRSVNLNILASSLESIASLQNNIFYSPVAQSFSLRTLCVGDGSYVRDTALNGCYPTVQNNIFLDPQISQTTFPTDSSQTNFATASTSPAIDAGLIQAAVNIDVTGLYRFCGSGYDIGAYEYDTGTCISGYDNDADGLDSVADIDDDNDGLEDWKDADDDNDGVADLEDLFPWDSAESADLDGDGIGNNADTDDDGDGILDTDDLDDDNDGVPDTEDAFPLNPAERADSDGDGLGDNRDLDADNDGYADAADAFMTDPYEWYDTDSDGIGNNADLDDDDDGILDTEDVDDDNDGYNDDVDAFPADPLEHADTDGDGLGDNSDSDDDNDGEPDSIDRFPTDATESGDGDNDGIGDRADTDDDNDGILDTEDLDDDNDGVNDNLDAFPSDPTETSDNDFDGIGDNADSDRDGDGFPNSVDAAPDDSTEWIDGDNDGTLDNADTDDDNDGDLDTSDLDDDNDGVPDSEDAFDSDPNETLDTDLDGIGNNTDEDDDGDAYPDVADEAPLDSDEWIDGDDDGIFDNADTDDDNDGTADTEDTDDDNDGVLDEDDAFPSDPSEYADSDGDNIGDNAEAAEDTTTTSALSSSGGCGCTMAGGSSRANLYQSVIVLMGMLLVVHKRRKLMVSSRRLKDV